MIYSKRNPPKMMYESSVKPEWANPKHAEEVRVNPSLARTVRDIVNRYTVGVEPRTVPGTEPDFPKDPSEFTDEESNFLFDQRDSMSAECIDINDHFYVQEQTCQEIAAARSFTSEVLRKSAEPQER